MQNPYLPITSTIVNLLWFLLGILAYMISKRQKKQSDYYDLWLANYIFLALPIDIIYVIFRVLYDYYPINNNFLRLLYFFTAIQWETGFLYLVIMVLVTFFISKKYRPIHYVSSSITTALVLTLFSQIVSIDFSYICFAMSIVNFSLALIVGYYLVTKEKFIGTLYLFILLFSFNDFMLYLWSLSNWLLVTCHTIFLLLVMVVIYLVKLLYYPDTFYSQN